ncbi:MAG: hypothetical protein GY929_09055 [Actinomycetia bacterium]|nr:hypothetical protein [Actinomycetes bacterium]
MTTHADAEQALDRLETETLWYPDDESTELALVLGYLADSLRSGAGGRPEVIGVARRYAVWAAS